MERKPSEVIKEFLDLLETADKEYQSNYSIVGIEDRKVIDFLHEMEFANNKADRNKIATKLHNSRKVRRAGKDKVQLYEGLVNFVTIEKNQKAIKNLRALLEKQQEIENYLFSPRVYKGADNEQ